MKKTLCISLFILIAIQSWSQTEEATTKSGKKVILYSDGTWKYAETDTKKPEEKKKEPEKKSLPEPVAFTGDCSENLELIEDPRTRVMTTRGKNMIIIAEKNDGKEISISMQKGAKNVISIVFHPTGAGQCIGEANKINIDFTDGSKIDLSNEYSNCKGESTANFGGTYGRKKPLGELQSKKIKSIRIWTTDGSVQQKLSDNNKEQFFQMINCLSK
jgi:hypothetical protein